MGTKNLSDHLNHCVSSQSTLRGSTSSSSTEAIDTPSTARTLDSFVKRSGKKVTVVANDKIHERTAALVASAHLPHRFVENTELDKFAQLLIEIGALYGNILASNLIVSRTTVRRDIVNKSTCIQDSIKDAFIDPAKYGAFSLVADLRTDDVASQSYQDVIFFWVEESGMNKRIWSLRHAMYAYKYFPKSKAADHIQVAIDRILSEVDLDTTQTPHTTDKGSNMLAATSFKCHITFACHRLSTSINTA